MASPAFQEDAFQNFTAHGIKGFQVTDSDGGVVVTAAAQYHHHFHAASWLLAPLAWLVARMVQR